jgi:hypothetical protein
MPTGHYKRKIRIQARQQAIDNGESTYLTGKPCKYGHIAPRFVWNHECSECRKALLKTEKLKEYHRERQKIYVRDNQEKVKETRKKVRLKNLEKDPNYYKDRHKKWLNENTEKSLAWRKNYFEKNKDEIYEKKRKKYNEDPLFNLIDRLRRRINIALEGIVKSSNTKKLIGCSQEYLKEHIENQFAEGMTWDNKKTWHIDHIVPVYYFQKYYDLSIPEIQQICFHYSNLQPLFKLENQRKNKFINKQVAEKKIAEIKELLETTHS